ncbi:MAG TPA: hypothetical protein VGH89_01775 [Pseudonocardia sp.]
MAALRCDATARVGFGVWCVVVVGRFTGLGGVDRGGGPVVGEAAGPALGSAGSALSTFGSALGTADSVVGWISGRGAAGGAAVAVAAAGSGAG